MNMRARLFCLDGNKNLVPLLLKSQIKFIFFILYFGSQSEKVKKTASHFTL